jgi:hypothetical protein
VAEEDLALALGRQEVQAPGEPLGCPNRIEAELGGDPVAVRSLCGQVGPDPSLPVDDPVVRVDHEEADAVVELAWDGQRLVGEEPPGPVGRRHGVVGGGQDHLIQAPIAQLRPPVAGRDLVAY